MQELNNAAELLELVEGGTLHDNGLTPVPWDFPRVIPDPIDPVKPPFQMSYGIWIPPYDLAKYSLK